MSSSSSPIQCSPDVLTQLVMQSLALIEIVQFARCNRRLLSQADSAFAFKYVEPVTRSWFVNSPRLTSDKLLRHVPLIIKPFSANLDSLFPLVPWRLYGFDTARVALPLPDRLRLLEHSSMQSLKQIKLNSVEKWASRDVLAAVARLPLLHTLSILDLPRLRLSVESLRLLSAAPSLTSIALNDTFFQPGSVLAGLVGFPSLKHLTVRQPFIYNDEWVAHFASPGLRKLTSLTLDWCVFSGPSDHEPLDPGSADAVFTSLSQLTSLHLKMPVGVDRILPSMRLASALRSLRIETNCEPHDNGYSRRVLPSFPVLLALMHAKSSLRIELDMRDHSSPLRDEYAPKLAADFAGVPADVRSRLTVLYEKPLWS